MRTFRKRLSRSVGAEVFQEYWANSSIHGVRYFNRDERTSCERFWWLVAFLLSMSGCGVMIYKTYVKWNQDPLIVTFSEKTTPVWDVQFPACPGTKMSLSKLNITAEIRRLKKNYFANSTSSPDLVEQIKAVGQLCNIRFHLSYEWIKDMNGTEDNIVGMIKNISLKRQESLRACIYEKGCDEYLTETITDEGICYTFNMIPESEIFRKSSLHNEYNYTEHWRMQYRPRIKPSPLYARGAGMHAGLLLLFAHFKFDTEYTCATFPQGYMLMIHDPDEYPLVSMRHMRLPVGNQISIALKPQMIVTTQSAADYSWMKRQCFFNHERHLRFFKIYNQQNCELECLANVTRELCGCVRFSMPRANDTKVCTLAQWQCMTNVQHFMHPTLYQTKEPLESISDMVKRCNCLPACNSVHYDVETTQTSPDMEQILRANDEFANITSEEIQIDLTTINIYFKESYFITSKRSELYGWVDFLANCGGLLGLFMGVSILSLLEIFYFLTIRPFSVRKKLRKPNDAHNSLFAVVTKVD